LGKPQIIGKPEGVVFFQTLGLGHYNLYPLLHNSHGKLLAKRAPPEGGVLAYMTFSEYFGCV
jgi:hypothetical protein